MITLIGATGFTGRLIAFELARRGFAFRVAGRDKERLKDLSSDLALQLETVVVDVTDEKTIPVAFDDSNVVINCAGPFTELGKPVVREAVRRGVHYLDTTGEQAFIRFVFEELDDEARRNGSALVPASAFEYALGDAAAELAAEGLQPCEEIEVAYAINGFGTSRGTRKSIIAAMTTEGYQYRDSVLVPLRPAAIRREVVFPSIGRRTAVALPFGEAVMVPRHVAVRNVTTLMVLPIPAPVLAAVSYVAPALMRSPVGGIISRSIERGRFGPSVQERHRSQFEIFCTARSGAQVKTASVKGRDPYGLTAIIAVQIASLLDKGAVENTGAITPSMVSSRRAIIESTSAAGVLWEVGSQRTTQRNNKISDG